MKNSCVKYLLWAACLCSLYACQLPEQKKIARYYGKFQSIPANAIIPQGWLKQYLLNQRNGLTGHLEHAGYPFNTIGWAADSIPENLSVEKWWPYEQTAYWVDGMLRCGLLLQDTFLLNKARKSIEYVMAHPDSTGFLGPKFLKHNNERDRWVHAVFFRALMAEYEATRNPKIIEALRSHYLGDRFMHSGIRESVNIEIMLWAYGHSGDTALLNLAKETYRLSNEQHAGDAVSDIGFLQDTSATGTHGVTFLEKSKLGAILFLHTGDSNYLMPSVAAFNKLDKYHLLVSGVNVSSEHLRNVTSQESHEICDITDYSWSMAYLLRAAGNHNYADKMERIAFNAAPGSVTPDFKALQYFSAPNQVIAARTSYLHGGGGQMRYAPNPGTECCPGNVHRLMPNFANHLWMSDGNGGLAATMYAPSSVRFAVGSKHTMITIHERTDYPFSDSIHFDFDPEREVEFDFYIRIPGWCSAAEVFFNGERVGNFAGKSGYHAIRKKYKKNDRISVLLPAAFKLTPQVESGVSLERGPLLFSLKIEEKWLRDTLDNRSDKEYPAYELFAKSPWNYALCLQSDQLEQQIKVVNKGMNNNPWSLATTPLELKVPARLVNGWNLMQRNAMHFENWTVERDTNGHVLRWYIAEQGVRSGKWEFTPLLPNAALLAKGLNSNVDTVTLVPYGATRLRITVFPVCK